ncbi:MAG: transcriptional regulator, PadR-like family [Paenibacillaceae bacterium]|jgi:DNA-binding PadR family transcriptional regulator|nr:transcriptional regulator, PadR-like family [Paenibacillaceae bacterium]
MITFSDIFITVNVIERRVLCIRDNIKGGALTETTLLVLLAVYSPNHGYGILQFIENKTKGRVSLGAGTLYGALNTLLDKKWIAPVGVTSGGAKKVYLITELGKQTAEKELQRMSGLLALALHIVGGGET